MLIQNVEKKLRALLSSNPTPFYCYDLSAISDRIQLLNRRLQNQNGVDIFYSAKANSHPRILSLMKDEGVLIDVASVGELDRVVQLGVRPEQISFTGPGKRKQEIERAVDLEIGAIVLESIDELEQINFYAKQTGKVANVAPRLTPSRRVGHTGRLVVGEATQFGFDEPSLDELAQKIANCEAVRIVGTHSHVQSQILNHEHVMRNLEFALETSALFQGKLVKPKTGSYFRMCLGGGFGIPYTSRAVPLDIDQLSIQFNKMISGYGALGPNGTPVRFALELGRYLVGEAGYFLAKVLSTKTSHTANRNIKYAIVDGGYSHCQIACGVGQVIRTNLPFAVLRHGGGERAIGTEIVSIAGSTCHSQDVLVREAALDGVEVGDVLVIQNVGAYGKQFSPGEFLLMPEAGQYFMESM